MTAFAGFSRRAVFAFGKETRQPAAPALTAQFRCQADGEPVKVSNMPATNNEAELVRRIDGLQQHVAELETALREQERSTDARHRAEEALRFEREQLLSIFDGIDEIIYVSDPFTYEVLYANKAMKDAFHKDLVGGICYRDFQGFDSPCGFCTNAIIMRQKYAPYSWQHHNAVTDRDYAIVDRIIRWPDGRDVRFEIAIDITDRKRAEEALRQSERQKELILNATAEMVAYYDTALHIIWANRAAGETVGKSPAELVGLHCYVVWRKRSEPCPNCPVLKARENKTPCQGEMQTPDGQYWLLRGYPVLDEAGRVSGLVEFTQNITERKRAEEEKARLEQHFHQAQRLESIGRLAGGAAHDLNNLLTPILGYGEMLLTDTAGDDPRRRWLEQIVKAGKRAQGLVCQLLAFGRKQTLEFKHIDLNSFLRNFAELLRRTIREDIAIHMILARTLPLIKGDVGKLEQVVSNLAVNAQDAMPNGGELTIETGVTELDEGYAAKHEGVTPGRYVMLVVSDTGCGMDAETRGHLFEPFFTTKEKDKGTGLGLATVYGIVKQHGGNVWAYSEPGLGAAFKVCLPVSPESPVSEERRRAYMAQRPFSLWKTMNR
jgi:PAS domain S-box-containing protein